MLARRQHPGNRVQPPPPAAHIPRRAKRLLASWWFRIQCGRRSAFTSYCYVAILVVVALTLALPLLRYQSLDEDSLGCLKALQGAESLVICDEKSALCESLAQMPLFYIVTTDALKHSGHLESALPGYVDGIASLKEIVFVGDGASLSSVAAAVLFRLAPHRLSVTLLETSTSRFAVEDHIFTRIVDASGGGPMPEWQFLSLLLPAPVPAFRVRGRDHSDTARVMRVFSPGHPPTVKPTLLMDFSVDTVAAAIDALGAPGALIFRGHRGGGEGRSHVRTLEWRWPQGRAVLAEALAGYDAIWCGEGCDALAIAGLLELAVAVAVPVVLTKDAVTGPLGDDAAAMSVAVGSSEHARMKGARLVGYPSFGQAPALPDDAALRAALEASRSTPSWEAYMLHCRRWLAARRAAVLRAWQERVLRGAGGGGGGGGARPVPVAAPAAAARAQAATTVPPTRGSGRRTVAFLASELSPVTAGGAGGVVSAMAGALMDVGVDVLVVGRMACADVDAWDTFTRAQRSMNDDSGGSGGRRRQSGSGSLVTLCLDALLRACTQQAREAISSRRNPFVRAAFEAAFGLAAAYQHTPFDAVELFDFNGPAYELLRARVDGDAHPYLPPHVQIWVRVHGTMGAIDEAEVAPTARLSRWVSLRHRLEQYSLEAADAVLLQSPPIVNLFSRAYQLRPGSAVHAPPPMRSIAAQFVAGAPSASEEADCLRQAESLPLPCAHVTLRRPGGGGGGVLPCTTFLVLGKLQRVKSPKVVAEALGIARQLRQPGRSGGPPGDLHAVFLGGDSFCEEHRRQVSQCLPEALPPEHRAAVHVAAPLPKHCLPAAVRRLSPAAAVLASEFETFNLAAHELASLRVPLIVSDVLGYLAFFNESNAYVFKAGDVDSLAAAMLRAASDAANGNLRLATRLHYADAVEPYTRLLRGAPDSPILEASEAASLWPSAPLRQLLRRDIALSQSAGINFNDAAVSAASLCGNSG